MSHKRRQMRLATMASHWRAAPFPEQSSRWAGHLIPCAIVLLCLCLVAVGCGDDNGSGPNDNPAHCTYVYDFEKDLGGWQAENWTRQGTGGYSGSYRLTTVAPTSSEHGCSQLIYFYPTRTLRMITGVDLSKCSSATLEFWHRYLMQSILGVEEMWCVWDEGSLQLCTVELSLNAGAWVTLKSFGTYGTTGVDNWTKVTVPIDDYVGPGSTDVRIAFRVSGGTSLLGSCYWDVDLVSIKGSEATR